MSSSNKNRTRAQQWSELTDLLKGELPHLIGWWSDLDGFLELRVKARDDGTVLAIAKGFDSDGGPIVCFGVGYDVIASVIAIDATINGNYWRVDHPWKAKKG